MEKRREIKDGILVGHLAVTPVRVMLSVVGIGTNNGGRPRQYVYDASMPARVLLDDLRSFGDMDVMLMPGRRRRGLYGVGHMAAGLDGSAVRTAIPGVKIINTDMLSDLYGHLAGDSAGIPWRVHECAASRLETCSLGVSVVGRPSWNHAISYTPTLLGAAREAGSIMMMADSTIDDMPHSAQAG